MVLRSAPAIASSLTTFCMSSSCECHPTRVFGSKLPNGRAGTEDCAADTQVCRTVSDGGLQIGAHPGRDPGCLRVFGTNGPRHTVQLCECFTGVDSQRRDRHQPSKYQMSCSSNAVRKLGNAVKRYATSARLGQACAQTHLNQRADVTAGSGGSAVEGDDQLVPVDGVDGVDVGGQRVGLVGLQLTDEVDLKALTDPLGQSGDLGRCLLIAVLPDVCHTELAQHLSLIH